MCMLKKGDFMYVEIKNPFGLRNGKLVTVNDLREDERGLACNCVCPLCKDPFEARLGTVRIHHFAHSGTGCNEVSAYLMGLYGFFREYVSSAFFTLPELTIYYQVDSCSFVPVTEANYTTQLSYYSKGCSNQKYITLCPDLKLSFEAAEIVFGKNERPEAVIATYHKRKIAFVISPPDTICKDSSARPFRNLATLEIMLSKKGDLISRANTEMMNAIFSDVNNYRWLSSPLVFSAFEQINLERKEACQAYQLELEQIRIRQEEQRKKQEKLRRQEEENHRKQIEAQQIAAEEQRKKRQQIEAQRDEDDRKMIEAQIKIPGREVIDSQKRRWIQCLTCGKIATEDEFWTYTRGDAGLSLPPCCGY